jgi:hypothetical protein
VHQKRRAFSLIWRNAVAAEKVVKCPRLAVQSPDLRAPFDPVY